MPCGECLWPGFLFLLCSVVVGCLRGARDLFLVASSPIEVGQPFSGVGPGGCGVFDRGTSYIFLLAQAFHSSKKICAAAAIGTADRPLIDVRPPFLPMFPF